MNDPLKISFITVCMGRKQHIQQTLKKNILDNADYPNVEFVLLDYNSKDKLGEWVKQNMKKEIESGSLKYYRTEDPSFFHRSHSRNMAFRLATGDILCNIDADNYTGHGFATYINHKFLENKNAFLIYNHMDYRKAKRDLVGRFCCRKEDFIAVNGYDETFANYGYEDKDIYERLKNAGREEMFIEHDRFLQSIQHEPALRHGNEAFSSQFKNYYISYISPEQSNVLCLMKDKTFQKGTIIREDSKYSFRILEKKWETGSWQIKGKRLYLITKKKGQQELVFIANNVLIDLSNAPFKTYVECIDKETLHQIITRHSSLSNQEYFIHNIENKITKVNSGSFGTGSVTFNFHPDKHNLV